MRQFAAPHGLHLPAMEAEKVYFAADASTRLGVHEAAAVVVEDVDSSRAQCGLHLAQLVLQQVVQVSMVHARLQPGYIPTLELRRHQLRFGHQVRGQLLLQAGQRLAVEDPAAAPQAQQCQGDEAEHQTATQTALTAYRDRSHPDLRGARHRHTRDRNSGNPRTPGRRRNRAPAPSPSAARSSPPAVVT